MPLLLAGILAFALVALGCAETKQSLEKEVLRMYLGGLCSYAVPYEYELSDVEEPDVLYVTDKMAIIQHKNERRMIGYEKEADNLSCHLQYSVTCRAPKPEVIFEKFPHAFDTSRCKAWRCNADPTPPLGMTKSAIAGAMAYYGGSAPPRVVNIGVAEGAFERWFASRVSGAKIDGVDHSAAVIETAPCFDDAESPRVCLAVAEGRKFLEARRDGTIDMLLLDPADDGMNVPKCERTVEFFQLVRAKMSDVGVVVWDLWPDKTPLGLLPAMVRGLGLQQGQLLLTLADSGNLVVFARLGHAQGTPLAKNATAADSRTYKLLQYKLRKVEAARLGQGMGASDEGRAEVDRWLQERPLFEVLHESLPEPEESGADGDSGECGAAASAGAEGPMQRCQEPEQQKQPEQQVTKQQVEVRAHVGVRVFVDARKKTRGSRPW